MSEPGQLNKEEAFHQMVLGQLDVHMQNNEIGSLPLTTHKS